ncbi:hypothetical protein WMF38_57165 [Sorangium sp. So ce118]
MDSVIAELERIASNVENSVSGREVSKLNDWGKGYHDAEVNFASGLRERVRQLKQSALAASDACDHGLLFDADAARSLGANEVRRRWPRLFGECPKGCGYRGIAYASGEHYVAGDW